MSRSVGITGTRNSLTSFQYIWLAKRLKELQENCSELHHGDCIGADHVAHIIGMQLNYTIILHPPDKDEFRAFCSGDVIKHPAPYLVRNKDIVYASDIVLALPKGPKPDNLRGQGTWTTIGYAITEKIPVEICMPDGTIVDGTIVDE